MIEDYYTVEQISTMLKIHPKTVQRYIREGKLRATKIGKGWRVAASPPYATVCSAERRARAFVRA